MLGKCWKDGGLALVKVMPHWCSISFYFPVHCHVLLCTWPGIFIECCKNPVVREFTFLAKQQANLYCLGNTGTGSFSAFLTFRSQTFELWRPPDEEDHYRPLRCDLSPADWHAALPNVQLAESLNCFS